MKRFEYIVNNIIKTASLVYNSIINTFKDPNMQYYEKTCSHCKFFKGNFWPVSPVLTIARTSGLSGLWILIILKHIPTMCDVLSVLWSAQKDSRTAPITNRGHSTSGMVYHSVCGVIRGRTSMHPDKWE